MPFNIEQVQFQKTELQYQKNLPYSTEVQWDIMINSVLPFVQNKDYQY